MLYGMAYEKSSKYFPNAIDSPAQGYRVSHAKNEGMICRVALSHPCGDAASTPADTSPINGISKKELLVKCKSGRIAIAAAMAAADIAKTASEPSQLRTDLTEARDGTL